MQSHLILHILNNTNLFSDFCYTDRESSLARETSQSKMTNTDINTSLVMDNLVAAIGFCDYF